METNGNSTTGARFIKMVLMDRVSGGRWSVRYINPDDRHTARRTKGEGCGDKVLSGRANKSGISAPSRISKNQQRGTRLSRGSVPGIDESTKINKAYQKMRLFAWESIARTLCFIWVVLMFFSAYTQPRLRISKPVQYSTEIEPVVSIETIQAQIRAGRVELMKVQRRTDSIRYLIETGHPFGH